MTIIIAKRPSSSPRTDLLFMILPAVTHLRPHQLPANAKCLYLVRDRLDVLASFYYHLANMAHSDGDYNGTPQEFCKQFLEGTILYGKWQDHLEAWLGQQNEDPITQTVKLLHYEDMKENLEREATKLARFLFGAVTVFKIR